MCIPKARSNDEPTENINENGFGQPPDLGFLVENKGRSGLVARQEGGGGQERCYRAQWGGGREERNMQSSSPKLNVLGVCEGDQDAFSGHVNTFPGEKLMVGSVLGSR